MIESLAGRSLIDSLTCGIVVYDEINEIQNLIPKLKSELKDFNPQWVFVLNHEQAEIRKWIETWLTEQLTYIKCIENPSNNLGLARQLILENTQTEYVYLTDPDIDITTGSLVKLIQLAQTEVLNDQNLKLMGFGGAVIHQSKNKFLNSTFNLLTEISSFFPFAFQIQNHSHMMTVDHLPACHLLLNKDFALSIKGFSAQFNKCGEDLDFTHRSYNADYRFLFLPSSKVIHWQNLSLTRWIQKIFSFGRVQIFAQKMNYKNGIRLYRLLPLLFLVSFIGLSFFYFDWMLLGLIALAAASLAKPGLLGFTLTFFTYALGEFFEIIAPIFEYKNELESRELIESPIEQYSDSKTNI